jgi:hypothetical protein
MSTRLVLVAARQIVRLIGSDQAPNSLELSGWGIPDRTFYHNPFQKTSLTIRAASLATQFDRGSTVEFTSLDKT